MIAIKGMCHWVESKRGVAEGREFIIYAQLVFERKLAVALAPLSYGES